jgi:hypothetical protein
MAPGRNAAEVDGAPSYGQNALMRETLRTISGVHRLLIIVALAILALSLSIRAPTTIYADATAEIETLQQGIIAASEQVAKAYATIYRSSELMAGIVAWEETNHPQQPIGIDTIGPSEYDVPDGVNDSTVTLEAQIKWADRIYRDTYMPFFLCDVNKDKVTEGLNKAFSQTTKPSFFHVLVHIFRNAPPRNPDDFYCEIKLTYDEQVGKITGRRVTTLDIPTRVLQVVGAAPSIDLDLEVAETLKGQGLGDFEDLNHLGVFSIRGLWADVANRSPPDARRFLERKEKEEGEREKAKIEILGVSANGKTTIVISTLVELGLMIYMLAKLRIIRVYSYSINTGLYDTPFFGIGRSRLGKCVIIVSLFILPSGISAFALLSRLPILSSDWVGWSWLIWNGLRWTLALAIFATGLCLIREVSKTLALLRGKGDVSSLI